MACRPPTVDLFVKDNNFNANVCKPASQDCLWWLIL